MLTRPSTLAQASCPPVSSEAEQLIAAHAQSVNGVERYNRRLWYPFPESNHLPNASLPYPIMGPALTFGSKSAIVTPRRLREDQRYHEDLVRLLWLSRCFTFNPQKIALISFGNYLDEAIISEYRPLRPDTRG